MLMMYITMAPNTDMVTIVAVSVCPAMCTRPSLKTAARPTAPPARMATCGVWNRGWTQLANINDPLPQAMKRVVGANSGWLHMLLWLGLFGLVASFHGIIIGYSRQMFALARAGYLPRVLARVHPRFHTPHVAILAGGAVGLAAVFSDGLVHIAGQTLTASIVTMSVFGAIVMYIVSMASLFRLRQTQPGLPRPFRAPGYPWVPGFALACAVVCLLTMVYYNPQVAVWFGLMMAAGVGSHILVRGTGETAPDAY